MRSRSTHQSSPGPGAVETWSAMPISGSPSSTARSTQSSTLPRAVRPRRVDVVVAGQDAGPGRAHSSTAGPPPRRFSSTTTVEPPTRTTTPITYQVHDEPPLSSAAACATLGLSLR